MVDNIQIIDSSDERSDVDPGPSTEFDDKAKDMLARAYSYILSENWGKSDSANDSSTVSDEES